MKQLNIHVYPSPMTHESRMLRITSWLAENGVFDRIELVGVARTGLPQSEDIDGKRAIVRISQPGSNFFIRPVAKILKHFGWLARVFFRYFRSPVVCINCHSLTTLPLCILLKLATGSKLIYDTHELETETASASSIRKIVSRYVERICIRFVDKTVVVGGSIGQWYRKSYPGHPVYVVRNIPPRRPLKSNADGRLRESIGVTEGEVVFLYLGLFGHGRGLERTIDIFRQTPSKHVVFIGDGELAEVVNEAAGTFPNIHRLPMVPPAEVSAWALGADVGLSLIEPISLSYYYSLPNKLFEYIQSGVPCLVSDLPDQRAIVEQYKCGWVAPESAAEMIQFVRSLDKSKIASMRAGAVIARQQLCWESESREFERIYGTAAAASVKIGDTGRELH